MVAKLLHRWRPRACYSRTLVHNLARCAFPYKLDFHSGGLIALFIGVQVKAIWIPGVGCQLTETHNKILPAIFIYSMCFDLIVLLLNVYKLSGITFPSSRDLMGRGRLTHMIFADGLIFFILACVHILLMSYGWKEASLISAFQVCVEFHCDSIHGVKS